MAFASGELPLLLPVKDIVKAHDFYTKVFGFTKTFENSNPVGFSSAPALSTIIWATLKGAALWFGCSVRCSSASSRSRIKYEP
jgi:hypothetical protein